MILARAAITIAFFQWRAGPRWRVLGFAQVIALAFGAVAAQAWDPSDPYQINARLALIAARDTPQVCGRDRCNLFVARVAELRGIPYFRDINYHSDGIRIDTVGGSNADRGVARIDQFAARALATDPRASGWREVDPTMAQDLANQGRFVLAGKNNHIVMVVPEDMQKHENPVYRTGQQPWVRDAQHPSGSVRASHAGNESYGPQSDRSEWGMSGVRYYTWTGADQNTLSLDPHSDKISTAHVALPPPGASGVPANTTAPSLDLSSAVVATIASLDSGDRRFAPLSPGGGGDVLGGIELSATASEADDTLPAISIARVDRDNGTIVLAGKRSDRVQGIRLRDFAMALWLVFGSAPQDPQFSLDPADPREPRGRWLKAVYRPATMRGRSFGAALFEADFLLKQYAFGVTLDTEGRMRERNSQVAGYRSYAAIAQGSPANTDGAATWARFWIVADAVTMKRVANTIAFDARMAVRARRQVPDSGKSTGLRDVDTDPDAPESVWSRQFTARYRQLALESPEFGRVEELAKAIALAKYLKSEDIPVDLEWIVEQANGDRVRTVERVTALSLAWTSERKQEFEQGGRSGVRTITSEIHLLGGVDLQVAPLLVEGEGSAAVEAVREAVESALSLHPEGMSFSVEAEDGLVDARVIPALRVGRDRR